MKEIMSVILGIALISLASAQQITISPTTFNLGNVYPGETYSFPINITSDGNYVILLNATNNVSISPYLLNITQGDNNITLNITVPTNINSGNLEFEINSYINENPVYIPYIPSSSSGGGGTSCMTQWTCSDWSSCIDGTQARNCTYPANYCKPISVTPNEIQGCVPSGGGGGVPIPKSNQTIPQQIVNNFKNLPATNWIGAGIVFVIIIGAIILVRVEFKKKHKEKK